MEESKLHLSIFFSLNLLNKARIGSAIVAMYSRCPPVPLTLEIPSLALSVAYNIVHLSSLFMI